MPPIPALFFTHDGDAEQTVFCLRRYAEVFAGLDVEFVVPVTAAHVRFMLANALASLPVRFVTADSAIEATLETLFVAAGDAEWLLWLTSDRYPIAHDRGGAIPAAIDLCRTGALDRYAAVKFCTWREGETSAPSPSGVAALAEDFEERPYTGHGFWHPQLIRLPVLRQMLTDVGTSDHPRQFNTRSSDTARSLDRPTLFPNRPLIKVEEPVVAGKVTLNYEARRRREGALPTPLKQVVRRTAGFANPVTQRLNKYWERADAAPGPALNRPLPKGPVHVVSYGGVGSKALVIGLHDALLARGAPITSLHSHRRLPPTAIQAGQQLIYVFGDPRDAVISFFARRERRHAAHGFVEKRGKAGRRPGWVVHHLDNLEADRGDLTEDWDLARYLAQPSDLFRLEEHFDNWLYAHAPYRITFVRYESLWQLRDDLAAHLGLDDLPLPERGARSSDWRTLDPDLRDGLDRLYGPFAGRLDRLPDGFWVRGAQTFDFAGTPISLSEI